MSAGTHDRDHDLAERRRGVRRTAIVLALIAAAFYVGFIVMAYYRAH